MQGGRALSAAMLITCLTCHHGDSSGFIMARGSWWPMVPWRWIFNNTSLSIPLPFILSLPEFWFLPSCLFMSVSICVPPPPHFHRLQSPACPTSRLPLEPSSPRITQKAMGTTWTACGSSSRTRVPESTWRLTTSTWRRRTTLSRWRTERPTTRWSSAGSPAPRAPPTWHPTPTRWGWSSRRITPCLEGALTSHTAVRVPHYRCAGWTRR